MRGEEKQIVVKIFAIMLYDIINTGDQDLAFGDSTFFHLEPVIKNRDKPVQLTSGKYKLSVLPVAHPATTRFYPKGIFSESPFANPGSAIQQWLKAIPGEKVIKILLSHSGYDQDVEYSRELPQIHLILGGHSQTVIDTVNLINGVAVQQAGGNGAYVGEMVGELTDGDFHIDSYHLDPMDKSIPAHPQVNEWLQEYHKIYPGK